MNSHFENISKKTDELVEKNRRSIDENKAKLKSQANKVLGTKSNTKTKKSTPKSKVARGMEVLVGFISIAIAAVVVSINVWPFSLLNGGDRPIGPIHQAILFILVCAFVYLVGLAIVRPIIKRLETKYGKQAW